MSDPANTVPYTPRQRRFPSVTPAEIPSLRAVFAACEGATRRIKAARDAGTICELLAEAHLQRISRACELAIRGQLPAAQATLEIAESEFEAFDKGPLAVEDRGIQPAVRWPDAIMRQLAALTPQPSNGREDPDAA